MALTETLRALANELQARVRDRSTAIRLTAQISCSLLFSPPPWNREDIEGIFDTETVEKTCLLSLPALRSTRLTAKRFPFAPHSIRKGLRPFQACYHHPASPCPPSKMFHRHARFRSPTRHDGFDRACASHGPPRNAREDENLGTFAGSIAGAAGSAVVIAGPWDHGGHIATKGSGARRGPFTAVVIGLCFPVHRGY